MNHTKPFWFFIRWGGWWCWRWRSWGGGLYEMVIRADRRRDGGEKPERSRGWSCTYLEVCDLIKAKLVYANKSKGTCDLELLHTRVRRIHTNFAPWRVLLALQNYHKMERTVINIVMRNNKSSGGCGHGGGGWLTPKQTSPGPGE